MGGPEVFIAFGVFIQYGQVVPPDHVQTMEGCANVSPKRKPGVPPRAYALICSG